MGRRSSNAQGPALARLAAVAMALVVAGVVISLLGIHLERTLWQQRIGPAVTLAGAVVWILGRRRR